MNSLLKKAIEVLPQLSEDEQTEVAELILAKADEPHTMSEAEIAACEESYKESSQGIFAPADAMEKILNKLRNA